MSRNRVVSEVEALAAQLFEMEEREQSGDSPLHAPPALQEIFQDVARGMVDEAAEPHDTLPLARIYLGHLARAFELGSRMAERGSPYSSLQRCRCGTFDDDKWEAWLRNAS